LSRPPQLKYGVEALVLQPAWRRGAPVGLGLGVVVVGVYSHEDQERWMRLERKKRRGRGRAKVRVWLGGRMVSPCG
jgi:hypothetical protein